MTGALKANASKISSPPQQPRKKAVENHLQNMRRTARVYQPERSREATAKHQIAARTTTYPKRKTRIKDPPPEIKRMAATE